MDEKQLDIWTKTLVERDAPFWVINKCLHRMKSGADKYGTYNPKKDRRSLPIEIEKELLDSINYVLMLYMQEGQLDEELLNSLITLVTYVRERR